ncbi:MAG: alpha-mannosidase [Anaerolineaceae bacterium]|nr:alpha-mannosidase [Anaerolineaceae bacterium]
MSLTDEWRHRIMAWREELPRHFYTPLGVMAWEAAFTKAQYRLDEANRELTFEPIVPGTPWGAKWEYGWFWSELSLPEAARGKMIGIMPDVGAESAVYLNEVYAGAVDEQHHLILITDKGQPGERFTVALEAYAGHGPREWRSGPTPPERETVPEPPEEQCRVGESTFGIWQETAYQLYMDVETLWDLRENLDPDSLRVMEIDAGLRDFTLIANFEAQEAEMLTSLENARDRLKPLLEKHNGDTTPEMIGFGHAHLDVAWLWPLAETERKCVRTFSTQLDLMKRYPEYKFLQSQPHLYQMVKDHYPDLYVRIKEAVEKGQWIPDGAAWVEPDTNISSGESLIRQLIHGKRFYQDEFGVDCELLWLPDVFGYSGALPQIMRGCGVKFFSTQKIFWAYNGGAPFPYNTFIWEGIDGSEVMAHFHNDYGSETKPKNLIDRWKDRVQKDGFSIRLFPFGWGDGGGGPTRDHLEFIRREGDLEGLPKFRMAAPIDFFREQEAQGWPQARYTGELYFQAHRGTYTSQARTKALNRRSEFALREAEMWGAAAGLLKGFEFPFADWDAAWKTLLLNQFHDILPGSSIHRVYEEAEAQLAGVVERADGIAADARRSLVCQPDGLAVFNSLSWERREIIELPEGWQGLQNDQGKRSPIQVSEGKKYAEINAPSCGWIQFESAEPENDANTILVNQNSLENDYVKVEFNEFGEITSLFDKITNRELAAGACNRMRMYQDIPSTFDAWDVDSMYKQQPVSLPEKAEIRVLAAGPLFGQLEIRHRLNNSEMVQTVTLRRDSRQMDFRTEIDWQERHKLLKVSFPVDYHAREALHEIQFGYLPRPTHRSQQFDQDRFEVCNQKWTALAEPGRGFAIFNDSKYGVDVLENTISLTLLKSALAPDMTADRGKQLFTYAFSFWNTPFIESDLVRRGHELNIPVHVQEGGCGTRSLFTLDKANVILETVKPPEDGRPGDLVLRLYEAMGTGTRTVLSTSLPVRSARQMDMLEKVQAGIELVDGKICLDFRPFEIKTLRLSV